jgi:uncharacterized protein YndB with AHSA1/START domain
METSHETENQFAQHLNSTSQSQLIVIERDFSAPIEKVFDAFINPETLKIWWWPKGLYSDYIEMDFREGGKFFINMKGISGKGGGMTGEFEEIVKNERIVISDQFADEKDQPLTAKDVDMPGEWPEKVYTTYEFSSIDANKTHFKLSQQGVPNEAQRDCYQGWNESFDKLENYLSKGS